jgi:formylmethanofuran dehydrogenase subunit C
MPLAFDYHADTTLPVEVDGLVQQALSATSAAEVERTPIWHGNRQQSAHELFRITGTTGDGELVFRGNMSGVHHLAEGMTEGKVRVEGDIGRHLGASMRGGEVHVNGSAGDFAGVEMRGGLLHIRGDAGNALGGAYVGSPRGMRGGAILVDGNAGNEAGHTMRRGLIAVGGHLGAFAAINMIAGTVLVGGKCGERPAAGMRRGTLVVMNGKPELLPTFRYAQRSEPLYLRVYLRHLAERGFDVSDRWLDASYDQYSGDHLNGGRGEIFVRR